MAALRWPLDGRHTADERHTEPQDTYICALILAEHDHDHVFRVGARMARVADAGVHTRVRVVAVGPG